MSSPRKIITYLNVLIAILVAINVVIPVQAARVELSARVGFGGYVVPGRWTPLRLELSGETSAGRIEIHRQDRSRRPVIETFELSATGKEINIECPVYSGETGSRLRVKWLDGGTLLAEATVDTAERIFPGHLLLTVDVPPSVERAIENSLGEQEPLLTVSVTLNELPQSAMGYDGVSAIVMTDPGPLLNPAQLRAVRSWLAGGGQLVLSGPRPGDSGLISTILPEIPMSPKTSWGLGKVIIIENFNVEPKEAWKGIVELEPFVTTYRLTPSQLLFDEGSQAPFLPKSPWLPGLFVVVWAIVGFGLGQMRRQSLRWWLLFLLIASISAFTYGQWLAGRWYKGASVETRVVYLPGTNGMYFNSRINPLRKGRWVGMDYQPLPWGIAVDSAWNETGILSPGKDTPLYWHHNTVQSRWHALAGADGGMILQGCMANVSYTPETVADSLVQSALAVAWWDGEQWLIPGEDQSNEGWRISKEAPEWFVEQSQWFERIQQISTKQGWLVGYGALPQASWCVQNISVEPVWWFMPVPMEVKE